MINTIDGYKQSGWTKRSYRKPSGIYISLSGPIQFESQLQKDAYLFLDFEPSVQEFRAQPIVQKNYGQSCLITTTNGTKLVAQIRYEAELRKKWKSFQVVR